MRLQQEIVGPWSIWPLVQFCFKQSFELLESCPIGVHYLNLRGEGENIDIRNFCSGSDSGPANAELAFVIMILEICDALSLEENVIDAWSAGLKERGDRHWRNKLAFKTKPGALASTSKDSVCFKRIMPLTQHQ